MKNIKEIIWSEVVCKQIDKDINIYLLPLKYVQNIVLLEEKGENNYLDIVDMCVFVFTWVCLCLHVSKSISSPPKQNRDMCLFADHIQNCNSKNLHERFGKGDGSHILTKCVD